MNLEEITLAIATLGYALAAIFYFIYLLTKNEKISFTGKLFLILSLLVHTISLATRIQASGRLPFANLYESLTSIVWGLVIIYLAVEKIFKFKILGLFVLPIIFLASFYAFSMNKDIEPLMPALQSNWLIAHVLMAVVAYAAFTVSFAAAIMYLIKEKYPSSFLGKQLPALDLLDTVIYKLIVFAFPFLTLLIITGAIWAEAAWGTYWSWDPKEVWSLITWLIYALFLHARFNRGWKGRATAYLSIIGFIAVIFTYFGVSFLLAGLHSYL